MGGEGVLSTPVSTILSHLMLRTFMVGDLPMYRYVYDLVLILYRYLNAKTGSDSKILLGSTVVVTTAVLQLV